MDNQTIIILAAIAGILLLAALLLLRRRQRVSLGREDAAPLEKRQFAPRETPAPAPMPVVEDANLEAASALAVLTPSADPVSPDLAAAAPAPGDALTRIKGLGPKAEAQLIRLGITRYADLAALNDAAIARLDAQMGSFKGRITRDRWVEQAALLAAGDTAAFEAQFGRLG